MKTMKSTMARLFALCLTVAMVLSMATTGAFATNVAIGQTGTITINSAASDNGAEVDLYKIMNVNLVDANGTVQPKDPMYTWVDAVATWLETNSDATYKGYINADDNAVTDSFKEATSAQLSNFFHDMKTATEPGEDGKVKLELTPAKSTTISATTQEVTEMEMGQYLVIAEKSAYVYSPATVTLAPVWDGEHEEWVLNDAAVAVKGRGGIEKSVDGDDDLGHAVGDTVTYRLDVVIPDYPKDATATSFNVGDTMGVGLTWKKGVTVYWSADGKDYIGNNVADKIEATEGSEEKIIYKLVPDAVVGKDKEDKDIIVTFEVQFNYKNLVATYPDAKYIHVVYDATLNEDAFEEDALGNDAYLGVNTDPYDKGSYDTTDTHEDVYTYGVTVNKVDAENTDTGLDGAQFKLYADEKCTTELKFVAKVVPVEPGTEENKTVYVLAENQDSTGAVLKTNVSGKVELGGLDTGTYYLKEVKAPGGYQLPKDEDAVTTIVLTDDKIGTGEGAKNGQDGVLEQEKTSATGNMVVPKSTSIINNNVISFKVMNAEPGFELPTTGGMGTVLFTAGGLVIMACGAALVLVTLKKKKAED